MRGIESVICLVLVLLVGTTLPSLSGKKVLVPLTEKGEALQAKYDGILAELKKEVLPAIPAVDERQKAAFVELHALVEKVPPFPIPEGSSGKGFPPTHSPHNKPYAVAQSNALDAATPLLAELDSFLSGGELDAKLAKIALMTHATPRGLAVFAQQGKEEEQLIEELLADDALIKQIMELGGCYQGKYGQGMQIYKAIQKAVPRAREGFWQSFALASSMEHPSGCLKKDGMTAAEVNLEVFNYYVDAYDKGELDEAFGTYSDFNWRFPMHHYTVEDMTWMREMIRNYRPDHARMEDYKWRYCRIVKTDVPYTSNAGGLRDKLSKQLNVGRFQSFLLVGGICGPRCFTGKIACSAFGIPVRYARQTGHAAMCHWTPDGWTTVFGASWAFNSHRDICGLDFSLEERARSAADEYMKVIRAEWVGAALDEEKVATRQYGIRGDFWSALGFYKKLAIVEAKRIAELAPTGEELAESNIESNALAIVQIELNEEDKTIVVEDDGVIRIPPGATSLAVTNTAKLRFMRTIEDDGVQVHYSLGGGRPELLKYTVEAPAAGKYELTAKVCTVTFGREMLLRLNRRTLVDIALPYTEGYWGHTEPVELALREGRNSFQFTIKAPNKGLSIREFKLRPVK